MMRVKLVGLMLLPALLLVFLSLPDARAQQPRTRRSRRITNPARPQPAVPLPTATPLPAQTRTQQPADAEVISSAADQTDEETPRPSRRTSRNSRRTDEAADEAETLRRTVNRLATQVKSLSDDLSQMRDQQRASSEQQGTLVDLERLSRAEQRAEGFRAQLREVMEKSIEFEARSEQLDYELQPDSIERRAALTGSLNPSALREQIRRQLESEKRRVQQQLELLNTSRVRLDAAVASADQEVERLRARMEESERREAEAGAARPAARTRPTTPTSTEPPDNIPR